MDRAGNDYERAIAFAKVAGRLRRCHRDRPACQGAGQVHNPVGWKPPAVAERLQSERTGCDQESRWRGLLVTLERLLRRQRPPMCRNGQITAGDCSSGGCIGPSPLPGGAGPMRQACGSPLCLLHGGSSAETICSIVSRRSSPTPLQSRSIRQASPEACRPSRPKMPIDRLISRRQGCLRPRIEITSVALIFGKVLLSSLFSINYEQSRVL